MRTLSIVLGYPMIKQIFLILGGAAVMGLITYFLLGQFANWYGPRYIHSDEDISAVYLFFLVTLVLSIIVGGIGGRILYRVLTSNSRKH